MGAASGKTTRSFKSPFHLVPGPMMGFGAACLLKSARADLSKLLDGLLGDDAGKGVSGDVGIDSSARERAPLNS